LRADGWSDAFVIAAAAVLGLGTLWTRRSDVELVGEQQRKVELQAKLSKQFRSEQSDPKEPDPVPARVTGVTAVRDGSLTSRGRLAVAIAVLIAAILLAFSLAFDANPPGSLRLLSPDASTQAAALEDTVITEEDGESDTGSETGNNTGGGGTSSSITEPTPVYVLTHKLTEYPGDAPCEPADYDYAWAIGGTWDVPLLRFSAPGIPLPPDEDPAQRVGGCGKDGTRTWEWQTNPGDVIVWRQ
jgi:hypothetical protein